MFVADDTAQLKVARWDLWLSLIRENQAVSSRKFYRALEWPHNKWGKTQRRGEGRNHCSSPIWLVLGGKFWAYLLRLCLLQLTSVMKWCKEWRTHLWDIPGVSAALWVKFFASDGLESDSCLVHVSKAFGGLCWAQNWNLLIWASLWIHILTVCVFIAPGVWVLCVSDPSRVLVHFTQLLGRQSITWGHQKLN